MADIAMAADSGLGRIGEQLELSGAGGGEYYCDICLPGRFRAGTKYSQVVGTLFNVWINLSPAIYDTSCRIGDPPLTYYVSISKCFLTEGGRNGQSDFCISESERERKMGA